MGKSKEGSPTSKDLSVAAPRGFLAGTAACGLKKKGGEDLAIIFSERPAVAAAVFTQNLVFAAPVEVSRKHLRGKSHRAIVVNSGGANACTGEEGVKDSRQTARLVAEYFNCDEEEVLVASTGVIGQRLNMAKVESGIREATANLSRESGWNVAEAIMTTDTYPKRAGKRIKLGGKTVTIAGVAKGAGMIHPNMATLLSFVTTDAAISKPALSAALKRAVNQSFNRVSVDGDTSTNDTLAVLANGAAENDPITKASGADFESFTQALTAVCRDLAIQVARDGEGARKLVTVHVRRAPSERDAEKIAVTVATSPLVKTAIAGADANWGRILAAAGRSGAKFDVSKVEIKIGNLVVARNGRGLQFSEERALEILNRDEVTITIDLHQGEADVTEWTCDLTEGYIRINADYRS
ncbi:MAG TPA: bifunctional glutamate N-acetyltransferase/amino-acid acetyltransferase ArgJ [Blastocatellia bacterium]|nr:bifunctional glutamate N-acetyltransferase/amino-acid acetyltransferase ArgJ [Blastocatellia bacterium]HMV86401.1 bifunctional glutamate N-acetyltransferase/amino-acid acetyltransferase ArgJ [Blastocatellia bacterium]HMX27618.1 bifunctional glutamate N-acetyltransferase/amino-acid acetyltransferase ArgJ [Blastocatellia bacterium]HMZ18707.1 bifunctional glutamate N-acetyltransferase/amino-acid acetyltransferase ArgJ [Blastocatellia bacterium]HNG33964.1 bifunctional glutamate N-acetyltransfera